MKKAILMTGALIMLMTTMAISAVGGDRFIQSIENEIYTATRTGQLTYNEARALSKQLGQYEKKLWEYSGYGNLSRQEERQLVRLEDRIVETLEDLKFNRVTVRSERYQTRGNGYAYGTRRPGTYYGTSTSARTRTRATTTRNRPRATTRGTNRGGGTYCPPPRRNW